MSRLRPENLSDYPNPPMRVYADCNVCRRSRLLDTAALAARHGDVTLASIRARLKCSACGSRDIGLTISHAG